MQVFKDIPWNIIRFFSRIWYNSTYPFKSKQCEIGIQISITVVTFGARMIGGQLQRRSYQSPRSRQQTSVGSGWLPKVVVGNFCGLSIVNVTEKYSHCSSGRLIELVRRGNTFLRLRSVLHQCCKIRDLHNAYSVGILLNCLRLLLFKAVELYLHNYLEISLFLYSYIIEAVCLSIRSMILFMKQKHNIVGEIVDGKICKFVIIFMLGLCRLPLCYCQL